MKKIIAVISVGLVVAMLGLWGPSPASGIVIVDGSQARMVGGGWVAIGDVEDSPIPGRPSLRSRATLSVALACPGEDVGFNPQPDPPGHLGVNWGRSHFRLTELGPSRCVGNPDILEGSGAGTCNGRPAEVSFRLTDGGGAAGIGNPDIVPDSVRLDIRGATPACTLVVDGPLAGGNLHMIGDPSDG